MPLTPADLDQLITDTLTLRDQAGQLRRRRAIQPVSPTHVRIDGVEYVNFASNNYLGLTHHPRILSAAKTSLDTAGLGSAAAPLITGYTHHHRAAESALAQWKQTQDAVLLPSGYQANLAAVQTLASITTGNVRFLIDKLAHASLIDAVRAAGDFRVYPHNNLGKLQRLLADAPADQLQVIVTESIFSMDGDAADLPGLVNLKQKHPFILLLDEAHGSGVYGPAGAGYAAELGLSHLPDITIVTLSKALGCVGGAICASAKLCNAVVNLGRPYIFSTSLPPMIPAAVCEALAVMGDEPQRQSRLRALARHVRERLRLPPGDSPIIPIILGDAHTALAASQKLLDAGLLVPAIRPPTVPPGTSRLRVTLSCEHTDDDVARLIAAR